MKLLWRLLFGRPKKAPKKPKKSKKPGNNLLLGLLGLCIGGLLTALELKWSEDLWKPNF